VFQGNDTRQAPLEDPCPHLSIRCLKGKVAELVKYLDSLASKPKNPLQGDKPSPASMVAAHWRTLSVNELTTILDELFQKLETKEKLDIHALFVQTGVLSENLAESGA